MTIRAVLNTQKVDSSGRSAIKICVTIKGKRTYYSTGKRAKESEWNGREMKKTATNAQATNIYLRKRISEIELQITELQNAGSEATIQNVSRTIRNKNVNDSFHSYSTNLVKDLKKKNYSPGTIVNYNKYLRKIKKFAPSLHFSDVDHKWLRKFEGWLYEKGLSNNSVHGCWKILKSVFNHARRDNITENYPFRNYDNPKYQQTERTFLLIDEIEKIEEQLNKPIPEYFRTVINYFLLGCYSALRVSDWKRFNYKGFVSGDRLMLRAQKNGEIISIQMHDKLKAVVERIKDTPLLYSEQKINFYLKGIATLAGITKELTCHVSRHSFCCHCLKLGMNDNVIARAMGISVKTLSVYKHLINTEVDSELQKWNG